MNRKKIIVIGGGVAGLTAATLLNEAGEEVIILEASDAIGGLAKSSRFKDKLPSEHSLRAYHKTYDCLFSLYKRIPFNEKETLYQQFVPVSFVLSKRDAYFFMEVDKKHNWIKGLFAKIRFLKFLIKQGFQWRDFRQLLKEEMMARYSLEHLSATANIPLQQFLKNVSSSYSEIIDANHTIAFAATQDTSAMLAVEFDIEAKPFDFFLMTNGPTSEQSLVPWEHYLIQKGVVIKKNAKVNIFECQEDKILAVQLATGERVQGDIFICATSALDFRMLMQKSNLTDKIPHFEKIQPFFSWSGGVQLFLSDLPDQTNPNNKFIKSGVLQAYLDSPWKLVSIVQGGEFWKNISFPEGCRYVISITFTQPNEPGILYKKSLLECNKEEILNEIIAQIKLTDKHLIVDNKLDDMIVFMSATDYEAKKDLLQAHLAHKRKDGDWLLHFAPYFVSRPNDIIYAPTPRTALKNLYLAGVHCHTAFFIPTMEKASESGYRAAAAISEDFNFERKIVLPFKSYNTKNHAFFRTIDAFFFKLKQWFMGKKLTK